MRLRGRMCVIAVLFWPAISLAQNAINVSATARPVVIDMSGVNPSGTAKVTTLGSADLNAENSFEQPKRVAPKLSTQDVRSNKIPVQLAPYSLSVYRVPVR